MEPALFGEIWLMVKIACVLGMTASHMVFAKMRKELEKDVAQGDKVSIGFGK